VVLGHREHAAGPAGRVEQGLDHSWAGEEAVVLDEEQVDHQPDDLTRGEVLAGGLVGELREAADELLVEVAHLQVADRVGMQVDLAEPGDDQVEEICTVEPVDLGAEVKLVQDVAGGRGEPRDVRQQVVGDAVGVVEQLPQVERGGVVELLPRRLTQDRVDVDHPTLQSGGGPEDLLLCGLEHAVEPSQDDQGQDDPAILGLLVVTPQEIGDRPDECGVVADRLGCGQRQRSTPGGLGGEAL
jgi:hypothetical protein